MKISRINYFRWGAIVLLVIAVVLLVLQLIQFSRIRAGFPAGTVIGGVAVGGLNQQQAADRLTQVFSNPIELLYGDNLIQVRPAQLGFSLDTASMIAAADQQRVTQPFWSSFWNYLWNRPSQAMEIPIKADIDENRIRLFLMDEIASRYDQSPDPSIPVPGTINFLYGKTGLVLDIEKSLAAVEQALLSPVNRSANLVLSEVSPPRPTIQNLETLLKQLIDRSNFDGLVEIYILDLKNRDEINFAYEQGVDIEPGIAYTAASTVKIPIMVSTFRRLEEPAPQGAMDLMRQMIQKSENPPADQLMETYLDPTLGPILVTQDMQSIGLENTFLAGHFYLGAPLLQRYLTPANQRQDYQTNPDVYNQTTPAEIGMLLDDIYQCAQFGGGTFSAVFPNEITQAECQMMINYLTENKIAVLLQAGLPDGTQFAHKHGWIVETDGVIRTISDAGIVFSTGGNYVITMAMYQPTQLIFDVANLLFAQVSVAVNNYFNIS